VLLDLLFEYKRTLRDTKKLKAKLEGIPEEERSIHDNEDIKQYNNMISHLKFVIEWLNTGRLPGAKRGYDKRDVYKEMIPALNDTLDALAQETPKPKKTQVSTIDENRIEDALSELTDRERDIFMLSHVHLMTHQEIANLLDIKKTTVDNRIERANKKIRKRIEGSLLCMA